MTSLPQCHRGIGRRVIPGVTIVEPALPSKMTMEGFKLKLVLR